MTGISFVGALLLAATSLPRNAVAFQFRPIVPMSHRTQGHLDLFGGFQNDMGTDQITELKKLGFTQGLCETMASSKDSFAMRYWIVDDSGSMATPDGIRLGSDGKTMVSCTRWKEVQDTVQYHAKVASILQAPTSFRLLNNDGPKSRMEVGMHNGGGAQQVQAVRKAMERAEPYGVTPLARKIREVKEDIDPMLPELRQNGQRVALIIATDGLPTDDNGYGGDSAKEELGRALSSLQGLPVWLVIRLCTDEDSVVSFYNQLDGKLELSMDVLDDWKSEAAEVKQYNRWATYGLPIHRVREMGCTNRILDVLDERKLTKDEIRDYCGLLFGEAVMDGLPDPNVDWNNFKAAVDMQAALEDYVLNPATGREGAWLSLKDY